MPAFQTRSTPMARSLRRRPLVHWPIRGFTIVEMLVVIGIIALLAGILLVALAGVNERAKRTQTLKIMDTFISACNTYQQETGQWPGVIPESVLAGVAAPELSSTENAILAMMGGYRLLTPFDAPGSPAQVEYAAFNFDSEFTFTGDQGTWGLRVKFNRIGEGPIINGKPHAPFFTPGKDDLQVVAGQAYLDPDDPIPMPDLVDAWGQPILYLRRLRATGPIVTDGAAGTLPQFVLDPLSPYLDSVALGELGKNQSTLSIFNTAADDDATLAQLIRAPAFGPAEILPASLSNLEYSPLGDIFLFSAGPDGVYFSQHDGPGNAGNPETNIVTGQYASPQVIEDYDDMRRSSGG